MYKGVSQQLDYLDQKIEHILIWMSMGFLERNKEVSVVGSKQ